MLSSLNFVVVIERVYDTIGLSVVFVSIVWQ